MNNFMITTYILNAVRQIDFTGTYEQAEIYAKSCLFDDIIDSLKYIQSCNQIKRIIDTTYYVIEPRNIYE